MTATEREGDESALAVLRESIGRLTTRAVSVSPRKAPLRRLVRMARSPMDPLPYTWAGYRDHRFRANLAAVLAEGSYDLVHCDQIQVAQAFDGLETPPRLLNAHNVESVLARRVAENEPSSWRRPVIAWQADKVRRAEIRAHRLFHRSVAVSEVDRAELERLCPGLSVTVVPNGVDVDWFDSGPEVSRAHTMAFVGAMDWIPNVDAVRFFASAVFPRIRARVPDAEFWVVGRNPSASLVRSSLGDGVHVTGTVDDVRPHVARSRLVVVPLRIGGGTRLKILEAWAMRKAVLSTAVGAEGLPAIDGENIELADAPEQLAARAVALLNDAERAARLGTAGRRVVEEHFSWKRIAERLLEAYDATVATARVRRQASHVWDRGTSIASR